MCLCYWLLIIKILGHWNIKISNELAKLKYANR